ncbi:MAG TPA: hypothetical protein VIL60_07050 [Rhodanobacter sp.]
MAQSAQSGERGWVVPPTAASSVEYRSGLPVATLDGKASPFRFRDGNQGGVLNRPPPRPMDRDVVLGAERAWVGGRPPLDCAMTPMNARCH